ncbi:MAG: alpha/beta fold hydrolase [Pirellulales bacterium]
MLRTTTRWSFRIAILAAVLGARVLAAQDEENTLLNDTLVQAAPIEIEVTRNVVYGNAGGEDLKLDLARPKGLTHPVPGVLWIHGGAWRGGNKEEFSRQIERSAQAGFVAVSIDYRLVPKFLFPAQVEDAKCAVRWLRANAERLQVDPKRIAAVGSSAGAHLSMMLGTMDSADGLEGDGGSAEMPSKVQVVVSYAGPTNLEGPLSIVAQKLVADFLGGKLGESIAAARPGSPINYVDSHDAPMLLIQGTKDPLVPHAQAYQMIEALTKAGVPGRVEILIGAGHGWPKENARVERATLAFLAQYLKK